jgi:hypothetical protein
LKKIANGGAIVPAGGRERQPIGLGKELERLVEFEEVGYALADERGLQGHLENDVLGPGRP